MQKSLLSCPSSSRAEKKAAGVLREATYIHAYIYTCIHTYIHIYIHTYNLFCREKKREKESVKKMTDCKI